MLTLYFVWHFIIIYFYFPRFVVITNYKLQLRVKQFVTINVIINHISSNRYLLKLNCQVPPTVGQSIHFQDLCFGWSLRSFGYTMSMDIHRRHRTLQTISVLFDIILVLFAHYLFVLTFDIFFYSCKHSAIYKVIFAKMEKYSTTSKAWRPIKDEHKTFVPTHSHLLSMYVFTFIYI